MGGQKYVFNDIDKYIPAPAFDDTPDNQRIRGPTTLQQLNGNPSDVERIVNLNALQ